MLERRAGANMKRSYGMRAVLLTVALTALGCQDSRPVSPTSASLFLPSVDGVWSGPMTLTSAQGGECAAGVVTTFLPINDVGTVTLAPDNDRLLATLTMESTGLACKYTGTTSATSLAMNATSCDRTGLIIRCIEDVPRELRLVGSSVTASFTGNQMAGRAVSTYNVFTVGDNPIGVGSLVASHSFTATRR
jgi:hypothetical protein